MQPQPVPSQPQRPSKRESYGLRDSDFQRSMVNRSAERQAAFLLPHLRAGMHLLDCGSGPGSITTDFAKLLAPGQVTGIDISASDVERATERAGALGILNVQFKVADIYDIPFGDATFDVVYSNAVLDHLSDPLAALREMYRVLKSGGIAGIRTSDRNGYLMYPSDPVLEKWSLKTEANKAAEGVRVRIGTHLRKFLREAGFVRSEASASYDSYGTTESVRRLGNAMANTVYSEEVAAAWRRWGESPDAFFGHCLCEAIGWKE